MGWRSFVAIGDKDRRLQAHALADRQFIDRRVDFERHVFCLLMITEANNDAGGRDFVDLAAIHAGITGDAAQGMTHDITGFLAAKALMKEGGVIACEAPRHPFPALHPAVRAGLLETARRLDPLVLRWGR